MLYVNKDYWKDTTFSWMVSRNERLSTYSVVLLGTASSLNWASWQNSINVSVRILANLGNISFITYNKGKSAYIMYMYIYQQNSTWCLGWTSYLSLKSYMYLRTTTSILQQGKWKQYNILSRSLIIVCHKTTHKESPNPADEISKEVGNGTNLDHTYL